MPDVVMESPLVGIERPSHRVLEVDGRSCSLSEVPFMAMLNEHGLPWQVKELAGPLQF